MEIKIENVIKKFKNKIVLNNINVTFISGNIYCLYGPNGSGKSILLKIICGLYKPTGGKILFDGIDYTQNNIFNNNIRALIENPSFFSELTGFENLKLLSNIQNKISDHDILNTLDSVNLLKEKDKKYFEYSLGMKQKLGIAQVLMENPNIIILDEPFNAIDKNSMNKIRNVLLEEKKKGKLIILTSHLDVEIENLSDKIYFFEEGSIIGSK